MPRSSARVAKVCRRAWKGKVPDVSIFQQAVVVILESFLLKVVSKLVGDNEAIVGVLIRPRWIPPSES